jgi:putative spermidine/putrescine transport system substrate-binding protein
MNRRNDRLGEDITRRAMLQRAGVAGGMLALPALLAACGSSGDSGGSTGASTASSTTASTTAAAGGSYEEQLQALMDKAKGTRQVIMANYGGTTEEARKKAFWDPFTQASGIRVIEADISGNQGDDMLQGKIPAKWDAFHGSPSETLTALKSGKKPLPKVPEFAYEDLLPPKFQPYEFQSFVLGFVPGMIAGTFSGDQPQTWADFFDTKKFPGKRAWPAVYYTNGIFEAALMADGVAPDELYPLDLERASAKIKSVFDDFVIYEAYPQAQSFLTSKTASMAYGPNGLWAGLKNKGVDCESVWTATPITSINSMSIMPDAPDMDGTLALAAFCADPKRQADFAKATNYGPPSKAAFDFLSDAEKAELPNSPGRDVVQENIEYAGTHYDQLYAANEKIFG